MSVIVLPEVQEYLDALVPLLYEKGYFSYEEGAKRYVYGMLDNIRMALPSCLHRPAPRRFGKGMLFATFRKNRSTTWYAFFTRHKGADGEMVYIVRHIANNHTVAKYM